MNAVDLFKKQKKQLAVLIDPDKLTTEQLSETA